MVGDGDDNDKERDEKWDQNAKLFADLASQFLQRLSAGAQPPPTGQPPHGTGPRSTIDNDKLILEELRKGLDRVLNMRKDTEGKANTIITLSGVILTLLLGFITLFLSRVTIDEPNLLILKYWIIAVILAILSSIILALLAVKFGRNLDMALLDSYFIRKYSKINRAEIFAWRTIGERDLYGTFIDIYTEATEINEEFRSRKTKLLLPSQILLIIGITLIGIMTGISVFSVSTTTPIT